MSQYSSQFLTVAIIHLLAVASPGPDFAIVLKQSVTYGRKTAIQTSLGVGTGILIHVIYSLLGIGVIISQSIVLFSMMKYVAALYLFYLGIKALKAKPHHIKLGKEELSNEPGLRKSFLRGLLTNGLNPKATLFFLSLFTLVIDHTTPLSIQLCYGVYMAFATALWFIMVSCVFGHTHVRKMFGRIGHWFDRLMGGALIALSLRIASENR